MADNVNELLDKLAIHELLSKYCFHLDLRQWDKFRPLFTDDAEWIAPYAHAKTGDEVTALMDSLIPPAGEGPNRKHFVSNLVVELSGDTATGRSNFVVLREAEGGIIPSVVGTYVDEYRREDGRWKFRKRDVLHEIMGDLGLRGK
jgi:3-phenylpropionate/cinnamic acid dioxygenase small subunit